MSNRPVDTGFIRQLADDLEDSGREATASDFRDCADEIDELRADNEELKKRLADALGLPVEEVTLSDD